MDDNLWKVFKEKNWKISDSLLDTEELIRNLYDFWWQYAAKDSILNQLISLAIPSKNTKDLIESNEKLAKSNEKYQKSLTRLTWVLAFVGLVQIWIQIRTK
jgi:hypothetical protein